MPIYEYECTDCNHKWEIQQKITDAPQKKCPECKKKKAKRLISSGQSFQLKGQGWFNSGGY
jgi:putative FmdB family regulatory protein